MRSLNARVVKSPTTSVDVLMIMVYVYVNGITAKQLCKLLLSHSIIQLAVSHVLNLFYLTLNQTTKLCTEMF